MHPLQILMDDVTWAGDNLAYNLKFIADDKLAWKPAPTAKSALEICAEVVSVNRHIPHVMRGENTQPTTPTFSSREEAQNAVKSATHDYAAFLGTLQMSDLEGEIEFPWGPMPKKMVAGMPVTDTIHHHGQIAYIQTLLGDSESHFEMIGS